MAIALDILHHHVTFCGIGENPTVSIDVEILDMSATLRRSNARGLL